MIVDAPRKAVFNTTELLENILLQLPARTLFAMQRVSRQFCEAIHKSSGVQSLMLAKPKAQDDTQVFMVGPTRDRRLIRRIPQNTVSTDFVDPKVLDGAVSILPLQEPINATAAQRTWYGCPIKLESRTNLDILRPVSWQDLYLADVVCKEAKIEFSWQIVSAERTSGRVNGEYRTEVSAGWTVGKLVDAALDQKRETFYYFVNGELRTEENNTVRGLMQRLENTGGRKVRVNELRIRNKDVILLSDQERQ